MTELACDQRNCPAMWAVRVEVYGQDLQFCMHHYQKNRLALDLQNAEVSETNIAAGVEKLATIVEDSTLPPDDQPPPLAPVG